MTKFLINSVHSTDINIFFIKILKSTGNSDPLLFQMVQARGFVKQIVIPTSAKAAKHAEQLEDGTETPVCK